MNINKNNYEAFFLDYYEGNLSTEQVAELLLFIEQHPEHKEEFESFENISFADDDTFTFENKASLKKEITKDNVEEFFSKSVDGTLSKTEAELLSTFIKQHPQFQTDLTLYQKTKLHPDLSIVFENKNDLKKIDAMDEILISSIEGLLSKEEKFVLDKQLATDSKLKNELLLFEQTKLEANKFIVYPNKEHLKRKERKAIPLFYYVAAVASIALLFSLFIFFNNTPENNIANKPNNAIKQNIASTTNQELIKNKIAETKFETENKNKSISTATPINRKIKNRLNSINSKKEILEVSKNDIAVIPSNADKIVPLQIENENQLALPQVPTINPKESIVKNELNEIKKSMEFLTIREIAVEKIKAKTLDEKTLALQKKSGKDKKINGWDLAQIVTKGISKVVGRDVELKAKYNEQGDITAYALGNGLEIQKSNK